MGDSKKEDPAEEAPLKSDGVADGNAAHGSKAEKGFFSKPRVVWCITFLVIIILAAVVLCATLLAVDEFREDFYTYNSNVTLMEMFPKPNRPRNLLTFRHGSLPYEGREWPKLTSQLDKVLAGYYNVTPSRNLTECFGNTKPENAVCIFDIRPIALECTAAMKYGYESGRPCIVFQFTNITDWQPEPFTTRDLETFHDLPRELRFVYKSSVAFLDCQGDSTIDQENIGPILYSPERGYNSKFFPFKNQPEYMSPLVAVHFQKPTIGVAISVTCKLWARNINGTEPYGTISFTLLVE